jgi:tetratricopeptide (TPR) repeat protein
MENKKNISLESMPKNEGKDDIEQRWCAQFSLIRSKDERGDLEGAIEAAYKATSIDPNRRVGWSYLGVALLRAKRIDDAVGVLEKARDLDPDFYQSWNILAAARWRQGDKQGAIRDYCSAANIEPKDFPLWHKLVKVVKTQQAQATAIENFKKDSENHGLYNLARLYIHYDKRMKAFDTLEEALKQHPDIAAWAPKDPAWNGYYGDPRFSYIMAQARQGSENTTGTGYSHRQA